MSPSFGCVCVCFPAKYVASQPWSGFLLQCLLDSGESSILHPSTLRLITLVRELTRTKSVVFSVGTLLSSDIYLILKHQKLMKVIKHGQRQRAVTHLLLNKVERLDLHTVLWLPHQVSQVGAIVSHLSLVSVNVCPVQLLQHGGAAMLQEPDLLKVMEAAQRRGPKELSEDAAQALRLLLTQVHTHDTHTHTQKDEIWQDTLGDYYAISHCSSTLTYGSYGAVFTGSCGVCITCEVFIYLLGRRGKHKGKVRSLIPNCLYQTLMVHTHPLLPSPSSNCDAQPA